MAPHFRIEKSLGGRVAGLDEVGRGPLAGPVVAAAVVFPRGLPRGLGKLLDDSKRLTAEKRLAASIALYACGAAEIGVGAASVAEIARLNILHASPPDHALVDGNQPPNLSCAVRCVIGGDATSFSIAAASIIAKVARDRLMARLAVRFPYYGWETNAGYGTPFHCAALAEVGVTHHHRHGFAPVRAILAGALGSQASLDWEMLDPASPMLINSPAG
jgi:ribonuclease HII